MLRPSLYDFGLVKFAAILPVALFLSVPGLRAQDISTPLRAEFVYVANSGDNTVSGYTINPATGALTAIAGSPFAAGEQPISVAMDPSGKFAYVANETDNTRDSNTAGDGHYGVGASVSGGQGNLAGGDFASVSGGQSNNAFDDFTSITGGTGNTAGSVVTFQGGLGASVSGGSGNNAGGRNTVVIGGQNVTDNNDNSIAPKPPFPDRSGHKAELEAGS